MELTIDGTRFRIDGELTYAENAETHADARGMLMNARFIQGVFDDAAGRGRYARFGYEVYDPEAQTDRLIAALPAWYATGLRAFTVGVQGGGPCFTTPNTEIDNNPFGSKGDELDPAYAARLDRLIRAADAAGMGVIVSFLYGHQTLRLEDDAAVERAVTTGARFLQEGGYTNCLIEVANEHDVGPFRERPIVFEPYGVARLIEVARRESGGILTGCSGQGGSVSRPIVEASDVVLIHGNGCSRQRYRNTIRQARGWGPGKPVVCNEDSPALSNLAVSVAEGVSWGYYNNWTKQEPPTDFGVLDGHDTFFAWRMAEAVGLSPEPIREDERFVLYGLGEHEVAEHLRHRGVMHRWPGLACLWPETVERVAFYRDGVLVDTCYDDPFVVGWRSNWFHGGYAVEPGRHVWRAVARLADGGEVVREAEAEYA
ncbi:MAG: hypothetical protein AAF823_14485 [Planctomycetota bacterium]